MNEERDRCGLAFIGFEMAADASIEIVIIKIQQR